jgi:predicted nucleic acid-binding protein
MDMVIDTSVVTTIILNEPPKTALIEATRGAVLLAPPSLPWEIGNALSAAFKRGRLTLAQAQAALAAYRKIPVRFVDVALDDSVAIAHRLSIYAYDAYVLRCAQFARAPLLSLDRQQIAYAQQLGLDVIEIGESS